MFDLHNLYKRSNNRILILEFYAGWFFREHDMCIVLADMAEEFEDKLLVYRIDVDNMETEKFVIDLRISMLPSYLFIHQGKQIDLLAGPDYKKLRELIVKYTGLPTCVVE